MKKGWLLATIYGIAVLVCALIIYAVPSVAGLFEGTYIAEYGQIEVADDNVTSWIIRDEKVYKAVVDGRINRIADEGKLVKSGSRVVEISGEGDDSVSGRYEKELAALGDQAEVTSGLTSKPGYVLYELDGYEPTLTPDRLSEITEEELKGVDNGGKTALPEKSCAADEPIFKIIANGDWYLVAFLPNEDAKKYKEGRSVQIVVDGTTYNARVHETDKGEKETKVILGTRDYSPVYLNDRRAEIKIIRSSADGLILRKESLVKVDGETGVIVKDKVGRNYFMPVRIKADNGEQVAVYEDLYMDDNNEFVETISTYDEILRSPSEKEVEEIENEVIQEREEAEKAAAEEARKAAEEEARQKEKEAEEREKKAAEEAEAKALREKEAEEARKKAEEAKKAAEEAEKKAEEAEKALKDSSDNNSDKKSD